MNSPLDTGTRLNIHKNLNVLCMFHLDPVFIGKHFLKKKKRQFSNTFVVESIGGCWSGIFFQFVYDLMQQILYLSDSVVLK